jgi:hypothetical protein
LFGAYDYYTGVDKESLTVTADFEIAGAVAGENLATRFEHVGEGVYQWKLDQPISKLPRRILTISVKDHQGNVTRIERSFWVQ